VWAGLLWTAAERQNAATLGRWTKQLSVKPMCWWRASVEVGDGAVAAACNASLLNPMPADQFVLSSYAAPHHTGPVTEKKTTTLQLHLFNSQFP